MLYDYTRVSTTEQVHDRTSLTDQERRIRGAAMIHGDGKEEPLIISDQGVSGSIQLAKRPQGSRLWQQLQRNDVLIAAKLDRLFRSAEDALSTARQLQERSVSLILVDMGSDPVTGNGVSKLFFTLLAAISEFERSR